MQFVPLLLILALAAAAQNPVTVHEWGTFTAIANPDGTLVARTPNGAETGALPCFVYRLPSDATISPVAIRLETSTLAFYAQQAATLHVRLDLPQAWVTAWYPRAASYFPDGSSYPAYPSGADAYRHGRMEWKELEVLPGANLALHNSASSSPYYAAARETDAATVRTRRQAEKMIFYRGFATFEPALHARLLDDQSIELRNTGDLPISAAIVFENHDGHVGFRVVRDLRDPIRVDAPELNGTPAVEVRAEMQRELQALGLFEKEAIALLAAARDSWFEPGTRVFYFVPPADIDRLLPLTITPAPASVTRALVGRVEILTQPLPAPIRGTIPLRQSTDAFTSCDPTPK